MIIKTDFQIQDAVLTLTVNGEQKEYSVQWCSTSCSVGGTMIGVSNNSGSCLMGLPGIRGPYPTGGAYGGPAGYTGTNGYTYKLTEIPKVTQQEIKAQEAVEEAEQNLQAAKAILKYVRSKVC